MTYMTTHLKNVSDAILKEMFDEYQVWSKTGILAENAKLRDIVKHHKNEYGMTESSALMECRNTFLYECTLRFFISMEAS